MDVDFWASRFHSAKHLSAHQPTRLHSGHHLVLDDSEGDDEARVCFPCPFCYVEIDVPVFCNHLHEEHCFDLKNAVCPLCAANLGKDVIGHFIVHHANSLKRKRKAPKPGFWNCGSTKELQGLNSSTNGNGNTHESEPDPLLSPFLCSIPLRDPKIVHQDEQSSNTLSEVSAVNSTEPSSLDEGHEQDKEERRMRAAFVQQLIGSTIF